MAQGALGTTVHVCILAVMSLCSDSILLYNIIYIELFLTGDVVSWSKISLVLHPIYIYIYIYMPPSPQGLGLMVFHGRATSSNIAKHYMEISQSI